LTEVQVYVLATIYKSTPHEKLALKQYPYLILLQAVFCCNAIFKMHQSTAIW